MSLILDIPNANNSGLEILQQVEFFADLINGTEEGQISVVEKSSGIKFINFKDSGFYIWDGSSWQSDDSSIIDSIAQNVVDIQNKADVNHTHVIADITDYTEIGNRIIVKQPSDLQNIDSTKLYVIDGKIDLGTQQIEIPSTGFFYRGLDYFVSCLYSTADNYTMFVNKTGESAGNVRGFNVEHYVTGVNSKIFNLDNQGTFGAIEFISCNLGSFAGETASIGEISNYRQFRTEDLAFIRVADGIDFSGTWTGGFSITSTILLSIPNNTTIFKEGTSLIFQGSSTSNLNALSVGTNVTIFEFQESNFLLDEGFILNGARFKIGSDPVPNIGVNTTKKLFKDCRAIKNTFPGGRWEITTQVVTPLTQNNLVKALGTTTYDDQVHFSNVNNNEFIYDSNIQKDFIITGQIVIDGGANDIIDVVIRKWNNLDSQYENIRTFTRNISNVLGGLDIAYFDPYAPVTLNFNDRVEVWIRNTSDNTNASVVLGSFLAINVRN